MRIHSVLLNEITFSYTSYSQSLKESLMRVGQNFPIYVRQHGEGFTCSDGHKRLSAISDILKELPEYHRFQTIQAIIQEDARTAPPYTLHNHH